MALDQATNKVHGAVDSLNAKHGVHPGDRPLRTEVTFDSKRALSAIHAHAGISSAPSRRSGVVTWQTTLRRGMPGGGGFCRELDVTSDPSDPWQEHVDRRPLPRRSRGGSSLTSRERSSARRLSWLAVVQLVSRAHAQHCCITASRCQGNGMLRRTGRFGDSHGDPNGLLARQMKAAVQYPCCTVFPRMRRRGPREAKRPKRTREERPKRVAPHGSPAVGVRVCRGCIRQSPVGRANREPK